MNNANKQNKSKKKVTSHIHNRIAKLAQSAIDRQQIISCDRIGDSYLIQQTVNGAPTTTQFTAVAAGSLLYLLNSLAANSQPEPEIQTASDVVSSETSETETIDW
ncbi:hypothetical protein [Microcoleus sp. B3-D7]|uniref:hypothetical protein n=1 Tax=Microcoleus sp. B3-D7 TaxID=2818659 RepID=UPI002FD045A1